MAAPGIPNYSTWRINLGAKFTLLPTSVYHTSERDILMQKAESRRELFEQIIRERRETESAEEELERIRDERRKAEQELERLRKILEGEEGQSELEDIKKSLGPEE
jgi:chromosome segregation ATPase